MVTIKELQRRLDVVREQIALYVKEGELLQELMDIYKHEHYVVPDSNLKVTDTRVIEDRPLSKTRFNWLYDNLKASVKDGQVYLPKTPAYAKSLGVGANTLSKFVAYLVGKGILIPTSEQAIYNFKEATNEDNN